MAAGPVDGVVVVDLTRALVGPRGAMTPGNQGPG
jgi:hypothetical protein